MELAEWRRSSFAGSSSRLSASSSCSLDSYLGSRPNSNNSVEEESSRRSGVRIEGLNLSAMFDSHFRAAAGVERLEQAEGCSPRSNPRSEGDHDFQEAQEIIVRKSSKPKGSSSSVVRVSSVRSGKDEKLVVKMSKKGSAKLLSMPTVPPPACPGPVPSKARYVD